MNDLLNKTSLDKLDDVPGGGPATLARVPEGYLPLVIARLARAAGRGLVHVAADGQQAASLCASLAFFDPELEVIELPAWDCLPYDRVSPSASVTARRIAASGRLARLGSAADDDPPLVVVTTANAVVQRQLPCDTVAASQLSLAPGATIHMDAVVEWLVANGFERMSTVRGRGEFAVRGGILDLYAPGEVEPLRLDFFGDTLESVRSFDPATQRTSAQLSSAMLAPMSEVLLDEEAIARFRTGYLNAFGAATRDDALYRSVSEGRRHAGMEHWLPLFAQRTQTLFEAAEGLAISIDHHARDAVRDRLDQIQDHYRARVQALDEPSDGGAPYKPLPPDAVYLDVDTVDAGFAAAVTISPFDEADSAERRVVRLDGEPARNFRPERSAGENVFEAVAVHCKAESEAGRTPVIAAWSEGSRDRLLQVLAEHGLASVQPVADFGETGALKPGQAGIAVLAMEAGFANSTHSFIAEQDILGDRLVRRAAKRRKGSDFLTEVTGLAPDDIVVHVDHGIGAFAGLRTIEAAGSPHDCLEIRYAGDDKLFLPVENIELLSRYGSVDTQVTLDRLGGVAWQARKAKLKKHILEMADQLIAVAAERALRPAERMLPPDGAYDEFAARFAYEETDDQLAAIEDTIDDLGAGRPMDRLICGDVGFGKTEVALRAAFVAAMAGAQVAVVVPTTLLARQHFATFTDRFHGMPIRIAHASRLVGAASLAATRKGLADGAIDIVIGTHALLGQSIRFDRLGLLVIDEEQRFGVKHKERLKELKSDVHVLTLSATPIPRTLQLALTGVRDLSLITTAPVDRMAVRTFISPFDTLVIREALLRERYRGGQSFYVCPRISDIEEQREFLREHVPELRVAIAHGQMAPADLDAVMNGFYDGKYDVLLSTNIVESGLDIPTANTLVVHRSDMFGLAQLYQLRGRGGRSKTRAYALFTLPHNRKLTAIAERRLQVLQSLDSIGAGFELASHDLDIRGSGNLLGEAQSGHVREVGFELYQQMLEEAVAQLKGGEGPAGEDRWSPQITIGAPVMIPESYVGDLQLRLTLYRRLADLREADEIDAFGAELIDRFGPLPLEVDHLLKIVFIKGLCFKANVEKLDAGPKGLVITFRDNRFENPQALIEWIATPAAAARIRPDQSLVLSRDFPDPEKRLADVAVILNRLVEMAEGVEEAA